MPADDHPLVPRPDGAPPDVRASDRERDGTIDVLRDAAAEGRLTFEELTDRIEVAVQARTRGELELLTRDLPAAPTTPSPSSAHLATVPTKQSAVFGDLRRSGGWVVPGHSSWQSCFGDIVLDLREAQVGAGEVTIDAGTIFGDIELLVPEGVAVEVRSRTFLGGVKQEAGGVAPAEAPRVILVGRTVFGDVRVRAKRLRERVAERLLGPRG